jgi:hypothetical protein
MLGLTFADHSSSARIGWSSISCTRRCPIWSAPKTSSRVLVESERDLHASKITCLLSRSEPRDLVDLLFLERAGKPPEPALKYALQKDAGIDPGVLAWLLRSFPVEPLPTMLVELSVEELRAYRDRLAQRFKQLATPRGRSSLQQPVPSALHAEGCRACRSRGQVGDVRG